MRSREMRGEVSRQINFLISNSNALEHRRTLFYSTFGRNRSIETIDGYDGTVHHGAFQLSRSRPIVMGGPDELHGLAL